MKVLENEKVLLVAKAGEDMARAMELALNTLSGRIDDMVGALKTQPFTDFSGVVDLLGRGGVIKVKEVESEYSWSTLSLSFNSCSLFDEERYSGLRLPKGKYQVTLIVEPLGAEEAKP